VKQIVKTRGQTDEMMMWREGLGRKKNKEKRGNLRKYMYRRHVQSDIWA
jgi:hypothetical protein